MKITNRDITQEELGRIYEDFRKIERQDGIPDAKQERRQFVAESAGMLVGLASGLTNHKWFCLTDLWVHEDFRRQGLGAKLLKLLEDDVEALGIEHIYLWTSGLINPIFYEKQGYRVFTVFENFYEAEGYHQTGYRKDLGRAAEE